MAVERAIHRIAPGSAEADHFTLQQRIIDAWKRRHTGEDPHRPVLILVGGYAGSGKSELARFFVQLTGWPLLDKDPLTRPLVERLLVALGGDPNDRHTDLYRERVRPVEYDCLMQSAMANMRCGISTVLTAPFIAEMTNAAWMQRLANRVSSMGVDVFPVWVRCDEESMREHIIFSLSGPRRLEAPAVGRVQVHDRPEATPGSAAGAHPTEPATGNSRGSRWGRER